MRRQPPGTSGAVSWPGTLGGLAGSLAVALGGLWLTPQWAAAWIAVTAAGFLGALVDSLLGAAFQAKYRCDACGATPQVARHAGCPARAARTSGLPGLDNDVVNWLATGAGAAVAVWLDGAFRALGSP